MIRRKTLVPAKKTTPTGIKKPEQSSVPKSLSIPSSPIADKTPAQIIVEGFKKPLLAKDVAFKGIFYGPPGGGKSTGGYTFPCDRRNPLYVIRTKPLDTSIDPFQELVEDDAILVFDCFDGVKEDEWNLERVASNVQIAVTRLAKLDKDAPGTIIIDDLTDMYQGLMSWMENLTDAKIVKSTGKVSRMEWGRIYDRLLSMLILAYRNPKRPLLIMAQIQDVFGDGGSPMLEDGLTTQQHKARIPKEVFHLVDYSIEVAPYSDFGEQIHSYVPDIPASESMLNIGSFKKCRNWMLNLKRDRFYNVLYPNIRKFMGNKGVNFYEPEGCTPFIPKRFEV